MSEKLFRLSEESALQYVIMKDNVDLNENEVVDLLNEQDEKIKFDRKHILCLQSTIQDLDIEIQLKDNISKERFEEIKDHWYSQMLRDDLE